MFIFSTFEGNLSNPSAKMLHPKIQSPESVREEVVEANFGVWGCSWDYYDHIIPTKGMDIGSTLT